MRAGFLATVLGSLVLAACNDVGPLAPIEPSPEEIDGVTVCGEEQTFGALKRLDEVSDACRAEIETLLGEPTSSFAHRLIVLGGASAEDGGRTFYVQSADATLSDEVRVEVTFQGGHVTKLSRSELEVTPVDGESVALAVASDVSRTLREEDLAATAELAMGLFRALPAGFEASVTRFSSEVRVTQERTTDTTLMERAILAEDDVPREQTALYDGMSAALATLETSERPIRLLFVVSDGPDNLPSETRRSALRERIEKRGIAGVGAGALFADTLELRSLFGPRGVVFSAPSLLDLPDVLEEYLASLGRLVAIRVPPQAGASRYRILLGDASVLAED